MITQEMTALIIAAAIIGFSHTVLGPDHYLPFVVISKARKWSLKKTIMITALCGIGHVAGSIVLGLVGIAFGIAIGELETLESLRGNLAAWVLLTFGLAYMLWGIRKMSGKRVHSHGHVQLNNKTNVTPWILFTVFVLGPCEPLIPILMYPAARNSTSGMLVVSMVFAIVTISTMTIAVSLLVSGTRFISTDKLEKYSHAFAGLVIFLCGLAIQFGL
jgi:hypothetical protein